MNDKNINAELNYTYAAELHAMVLAAAKTANDVVVAARATVEAAEKHTRDASALATKAAADVVENARVLKEIVEQHAADTTKLAAQVAAEVLEVASLVSEVAAKNAAEFVELAIKAESAAAAVAVAVKFAGRVSDTSRTNLFHCMTEPPP